MLISTSNCQAAAITLTNAAQSVTLDPQTLNIAWDRLSVNEADLSVDGTRQTVTALQQNADNNASWTLMPANIHINASLTTVLSLSFTLDPQVKVNRDRPISMAWFDLPEAATRTLYLPFSEGMRVPTDHKVWATYLRENHSGANTTQDLKMPFWTTEQDSRFINYQLVTATNNRLTFDDSQPKLDMRANHLFTPLNRDQAFEVNISLGYDVLSGAKQYRQWRIDQAQAQPLAEKLRSNPELAKLIGAAQVYLFGKEVLAVEDVTDWWGLKDWYFSQSALSISENASQAFTGLTKAQQGLSRYHKQLLIDSLNASLKIRFPATQPQVNNNAIGAQFDAAQRRKQWLSQHAGNFLSASEHWGQALSKGMITNMQEAGLEKLWLGLDNWMPAFYQPQVVDQAKRAGYLVATYDSYNTAIPLGLNDAWLTAQLPDEMRLSCAIETADGTKKKGFRGNGNYLNPNCYRGYVEQRIKDIVKYGRFNSLFIDVDATAMAQEDYRSASNHNTSHPNTSSERQMLDAFNDRMEWIAKSQRVLLGSEDGNSLTTKGIAFAHGLETIGFGWGDTEMKTDRQSPYYLGAWFPDHKPAYFFKPAQVKEPYKTLLFSPQYRVPLYQAVFHDEVINSHHWHSDSLKFSDVQVERDLLSMLYNTPAMVHLNREEANSVNGARLAMLKHYQDGFLPLHQALWDKSLTDFRWLDTQGRVQQTRFSDGSELIANFTQHDVTYQKIVLAPMSITARLSNGALIRWKSRPNEPVTATRPPQA